MMVRGLVAMALACLALSGCAPERGHAEAQVQAVASPAVDHAAAAALDTPAPVCNTEGCCKGHGQVAYVQRDEMIICTDGQPSEICDCHS